MSGLDLVPGFLRGRGYLGAEADGLLRLPPRAVERDESASLFVVGDASHWPQSIAVVVAEGTWAGMAANYDLIVRPKEG